MSEEALNNPETKGTFFDNWADTFLGVIVAPKITFQTLADNDSPPSKKGLLGAFVCVLIGISLTAFIRFNPKDPSTLLNVFGFMLGGFADWLFLTYVLVLISAVTNRRVKFTKALTTTGWAFLPFIFFAPLSCFKHVKILFFLLAPLPAFWLLFLQWLAFKCSLKLSTLKLLAIILVVPPLLFTVYFFWIGLSLSILALEFLL